MLLETKDSARNYRIGFPCMWLARGYTDFEDEGRSYSHSVMYSTSCHDTLIYLNLTVSIYMYVQMLLKFKVAVIAFKVDWTCNITLYQLHHNELKMNWKNMHICMRLCMHDVILSCSYSFMCGIVLYSFYEERWWEKIMVSKAPSPTTSSIHKSYATWTRWYASHAAIFMANLCHARAKRFDVGHLPNQHPEHHPRSLSPHLKSGWHLQSPMHSAAGIYQDCFDVLRHNPLHTWPCIYTQHQKRGSTYRANASNHAVNVLPAEFSSKQKGGLGMQETWTGV